MFGTLISKEFRGVVTGTRFVATFVVCSSLIVLSILVGVKDHNSFVAQQVGAARFLEQEYQDLNQDERTAFSRLLEESDMALLAWFTGRSVPHDAAYSRLVALIRTGSAPG